MNAPELGIILGRISSATKVPQLYALAEELIDARDDDVPTTNKLLLIVAKRWKTLEARN